MIPSGEPNATVDQINVAQFYYLIRENKNLREVIQTIGHEGVLLLGCFTPERKVVVDELRNELRRRNYLPMMFDFEQLNSKTFTDTLLTLAGMSRFVIADLTKPASIPHELQVIIPNFVIPIVPIMQQVLPRSNKAKLGWSRLLSWDLPRLLGLSFRCRRQGIAYIFRL